MRFAEGLNLELVHVMMSSNFFSANCRARNVQYIRVGKIVIKDDGVLRLLASFAIEAAVENAVDDPSSLPCAFHFYVKGPPTHD